MPFKKIWFIKLCLVNGVNVDTLVNLFLEVIHIVCCAISDGMTVTAW